MSQSASPTQFFGKTWIFVAQAIVFGGMGLFSAVLGPLCLLGLFKDVHGQPRPSAGIPLIVFSVPSLMLFALALFNILARRQPLLRLCREGIVISMIGSSSLDGVPLIPGLLRVAWLIVSGQGFKKEVLIAPWETVHEARVDGPPMDHTLTVFASFYGAADADLGQQEPVAGQITLPEAAYSARLDQIAGAINGFCEKPDTRRDLPSCSH